jgi:hypothetical protein
MTRRSLVAALTVALALLLTSSASAQFGRGFRIPPIVQEIMMLRAAPVQKELKMNEDQTKAIIAIATQMQSDAMEIMSGLQDLTPEERQQELPNVMEMITEKAKDLQEKADAILDDAQKSRLKELSLQARGVEALEDKAVAEALKITDEQKSKLKEIQDSAAGKQDEIIQEALKHNADREKIREKIQAMRKELGDKALTVLTDEQRSEFEKMKGAKFDFPRQRGFGF